MVHVAASHGEYSEHDVLQMVASLEVHVEHPLAFATLEASKAQGMLLHEVVAFEVLPGLGIRGKVHGRSMLCGNRALMDRFKISTDASADQVDDWEQMGASVMFLANEDRVLGWVAVHDPIKSTTKLAVQQLQAMGLQVVMLTGIIQIAEAVARQIGIESWRAELLPHDKACVIQAYQAGKGCHGWR